MADNLVAGGSGLRDQVYVRDLESGEVWRVSQSRAGEPGNAASRFVRLSGDGSLVAFASEATNLDAGDTNGVADVFLHDGDTGRSVLVSVAAGAAGANGPSDNPVVSEDGSQVAFVSGASNLVEGDRNEHPDVFVRHLPRGDTVRASVGAAGVEANEESGVFGVAMSPDGSCVAFESYASNLVPEDGDGMVDVFVWQLR